MPRRTAEPTSLSWQPTARRRPSVRRSACSGLVILVSLVLVACTESVEDSTSVGDLDPGAIYELGKQVYENEGRCSACHGVAGEGGTGTVLAGGAVLETFPPGACGTEISFISIGTADWPDATYGVGKMPGGSGAAMPGMGRVLSLAELQAVAVYERVEFGGQALQAAADDCIPGA